jgi:hypothetical protein
MLCLQYMRLWHSWRAGISRAMTITVLGLGRMGAAMAARLDGLGWEVTGWTRSGRPVDSVKVVDDPGDAVADADVVILSLFDGPACVEVLDRVRDCLRPDAVVVNTSTIAPAEAAALAGRLGAAYVHAPVLGSGPAIADGTLEILAGASEQALARVRPVLDALGQVRPAGDASTAAALKLIADSPAGPDADIALAATAPAADEEVLAPLRAYIRGHATGNPVHFRAAFLPSAHVEGVRDGAFVSWSLDDYCALFSGQPAADEATRSRRIDSVDVHGTVATASMTLWHGRDTFTDIFLLVHVDGQWKIANKAYHRSSTA